MAKLRFTWMFGLMALLLLVAGCVEMEWETVVGSGGNVEQTTFRFITDNEELFEEAWTGFQENQADYEALYPHIQVTGQTEGPTYMIEVAADFEGARQAGIDLETITRNSNSLNVFYDVLQGTGVDPETGHVYVDYVFEPDEEFSDPFLRMLMADMGYVGPIMRTITHMPGNIVGDVGEDIRHEAKITRTSSSSVQAEVSLTELNRTLELRIESEPTKDQPIKPEKAERPVDSRLTPIERPAPTGEGPPERPTPSDERLSEVQVWEPFARSPEPPQVIERVSLSRLFQEPFNESSRTQLTDAVSVKDVSISESGLIGPELVGEIINEGSESFRWVGLGVSFFDLDGQLVEYVTLMIPNVEAGQRRGFKKYLYQANIDAAVTYRLEWNYGF